MGGMGLSRSLVASLIFMISMHTVYQSIHALQNQTTPSSSISPSTRILRVGLPWKTYFTELVSVGKNETNITGFCVEVFEAAIKTLNYSVVYIPFGNGVDAPPSYDNLIQQIEIKKLDAVVGDVTITANRSQLVEFTQPFFDSGLVVVIPLKDQDIISFGWDFMKPFSPILWLLIAAAFFISGGLAVYLMERRNNPRFQGHPDKQFGNVLLFSFSTWFGNQDATHSIMGRTVVVAWLFVTGILYSCYTANLSAILTTPRFEPTLNDIHGLVARPDVKIGYWNGSFTRDFLISEFGIDQQRLIPLTREDDYYNALSSGRVGAVIDECPIMQSLLPSNCSQLTFAGQPFATLNWGFAFDRTHHELATTISVRILEISENGELHRIQTHWLPYYESDCSQQSQSGSSQLHVRHFWGLFVIAGLVSVIVLLISMARRGNISTVTTETPEGSSGHGGDSAV